MSRQIEITTPVYAAIWSARQEGEETEDQILKRLLACKSHEDVKSLPVSKAKSGFFDKRNWVKFPHSFQISREYKGKRFTAEARDGTWVRLDDGRKFRSLNQLNASITAGPENVWNGSWTYVDEGGRVRSINQLRKK